MSQNKGSRAAILSVLVGGLGVGALAYYVKSTPDAARVPDEIRIERPKKNDKPSESATPDIKPEPKTADADTVRLPAFGDDISDMELEKGQTPVPNGQDAMVFVAQRITDAANFEGAKVLGIEVRDHVAYIGFNKAVEKGMGSMEEGAFLRAFQVGFGQFTDVDKVALEANGQPLQSGHVDLSEPLPVIRPGEKAPAEDPKPVEP